MTMKKSKEGRKKSGKVSESAVRKSLDCWSYDLWIFQNHVKERLKALGIIE